MIHRFSELSRPLDLNSFCQRPGPVEIEIGVGKGRFLSEYAAAHPQTNFIGIEKAGRWLGRAAEKLEKSKVKNVQLILGPAEEFLAQCILDATISAYHVYFPDPWPKRRHQRRRLFQPAFFEQVRRTLVPGGTLYLATDHRPYFQEIEKYFRAYRHMGLSDAPRERGPYTSNFQAKYEKEGRPIYYVMAQTQV